MTRQVKKTGWWASPKKMGSKNALKKKKKKKKNKAPLEPKGEKPGRDGVKKI